MLLVQQLMLVLFLKAFKYVAIHLINSEQMGIIAKLHVRTLGTP